MSDIETWTADECAAAWQVKTLTFMGYVSRGQAPAPLAERDRRGRRLWSADEVRDFPRPGPGHSRAGAGQDADALLDEMRGVAEQIEELRARQRELLARGADRDLEIAGMAKALGISRQTAYSWLRDKSPSST